jgi:hypothetical protein
MYVDVRWIVLVVVVVGVIICGVVRPDLVPALTLGVGCCGVLYIVLRLGGGEGGGGTSSL